MPKPLPEYEEPARMPAHVALLRYILKHPAPEAGGGNHQWLMGVMRATALAGGKPELGIEMATKHAKRQFDRREFSEAIAKAFGTSSSPAAGNASAPRRKPPPKWGKYPQEWIDAYAKKDYGLAELFEDSPVEIDEGDTASVVRTLFPGDPIICAGIANNRYHTRRLSKLELDRYQFIVPSPMSSFSGTTQPPKARKSRRCLNNTGPRKYLVTEFDTGSLDDHAGIVAHLTEFEPLVMVLHSGNKSLHAWWRVVHDEDRTHRFMQRAVAMGADTATWARCQLVRIPEGYRPDTRRLQSVVYFDPQS